MRIADYERVYGSSNPSSWRSYIIYSSELVLGTLNVTIHEMGWYYGGVVTPNRIAKGSATLTYTDSSSSSGTSSVSYTINQDNNSHYSYNKFGQSKTLKFTRLADKRDVFVQLRVKLTGGEEGTSTVRIDLRVPKQINFNVTRFINPTDAVSRVATKVLDKGNNTITLEGAVYRAYAPSGITTPVEMAGTKHIERAIPKLSHVVEWNNRLWGVNDDDNTIYASKLGDPRNWRYYQGTNMDSYYANQATLGQFTGVGKYSNHLVFFKENVLHKVYGSAPSSFQVLTQDAYGVKEGCEKSVAVVNDAIIYYSRHGFMVYEGETPYRTGYKLGETNYSSIEAAENDSKYYGHTRDDAFGDVLLVFDLETGCWYVESCNCGTDGKVVMAKHNGLLIKHDTLNGFKIIEPVDTFYEELEEDFEWHGVFKFDEFIENAKIYSKIDARVILSEGSTLKVEIAMDKPSFGDVTEWIKIGEYTADGGEVVAHVPIIPRRCNNFYVRLSGTGKSKLLSMTRKYRPGSARYKR